MSEILSQNEIDALLKSIDDGDSKAIKEEDNASEKKIKAYNFKRPSKFNKDHLRTLEILFDNYAREVSSFLSGYLRTNSTIEVANVEQVTYSEFSNSLVNPVLLGVIDFKPLKGSVIIDVSTNIAFSMIDRILGGPGFTIKKIRDFSEIEVILLERLMSQMVSFLGESWQNVASIEPKLERVETNSQFAQIISQNEMIALVMLEIKVGSVEGYVNFCIPHMVVEPIMEKLNTKHWYTSYDEQEDNNIFQKKIESSLEFADVPVSTIIGRTNISVADFVLLQKGDIIPLDTFIDSDLNVKVGDLIKFKAKPGISKGKNAIQITSVIGKEDKNNG